MMSIVCIGGLFGNISFLWILEKFGRKRPILLLAVPAIVCLLQLFFNSNKKTIIVLFFILGQLAVDRLC